jgi:hypothetical protein
MKTQNMEAPALAALGRGASMCCIFICMAAPRSPEGSGRPVCTLVPPSWCPRPRGTNFRRHRKWSLTPACEIDLLMTKFTAETFFLHRFSRITRIRARIGRLRSAKFSMCSLAVVLLRVILHRCH